MKGVSRMEFKDIKAFVEVANHLSFTKAAESSYVSQPSLSKAVKKLEEELNMTLFNRSTRQLRLTDAGEIVYKQGKQALASLNEVHLLLDELTKADTGEINLGMPPLIGTLFFPEIARIFHQRYPNVKINLVELGAKVVEDLVEEGQIDAGIIVLPTNDHLFNVQPFIEDNFVLFVHKDHLLSHLEAVDLAEFKNEKFIIFDKSFALHNYIINACNEAGFNPNISYESSQWDLIVELVASKLGITLLPQSIFKNQSNPAIKMIPLKSPSLKWQLGVITKKDTYHSFALKKLTEMLHESKFS